MDATVSQRFLADLESVPTLPSVVTRVLEIVLDPNASIQDAARIVEADQALSSKVLKVINSAVYGLRQKVSTIGHATALLGFNSLKSIVLSVAVFDSMLDNRRTSGLDKTLFWQHCLACAASSRAIARQTGYDLPEEAYVAGLLHDIGKVIFDQIAEKDFARVLEILRADSMPIIQAERSVFGVDHPAVGGDAAGRWNFPPILCDAIRHHHTADLPATALPARHQQLAAIVAAGDFFCWSLGMGSIEVSRIPELSASVAGLVRMETLNHGEIAEAVDKELTALGTVFKFDLPDGKRFRQALQKANLELGRINTLYDEARRQLETRVRELTELNEAIRKARQTLSQDGVRTTIMDALQSGLGFDRAVFLALDRSAGELRALEVRDVTQIQANPSSLSFRAEGEAPLLAHCEDRKRPFLLSKEHSGGIVTALFGALQTDEMAVIPVLVQGDLSGLILVDNAFSRRPISADALQSLAILAQEVGLALENARLFERTQELATKDELTSVFNRRQTLEKLTYEMERARRYSRPLSMAMLDVDHFKKFNDLFGHLSGDQVLQDVAKIIKGASREVDHIGRYGGEEFMAVLPETGPENSMLYAERVRMAVERFGTIRQATYPGLVLTISVGLACYEPEKDTTRELFIARADKALYAAKDRGRNRCCRI